MIRGGLWFCGALVLVSAGIALCLVAIRGLVFVAFAMGLLP